MTILHCSSSCISVTPFKIFRNFFTNHYVILPFCDYCRVPTLPDEFQNHFIFFSHPTGVLWKFYQNCIVFRLIGQDFVFKILKYLKPKIYMIPSGLIFKVITGFLDFWWQWWLLLLWVSSNSISNQLLLLVY